MFANIRPSYKLLHIIPVIPVYLIILTVVYAFTINYAFEENGYLTMTKLIAVPTLYISAFMVIVCHTFAMWTNPGEVLINKSNNSNNSLTQANMSTNVNVDDHVHHHNNLFCKKCKSSRPDRSHHCKICNKCIMKMDHHCPWIANCVGMNNQKYFYLFLFYSTLGDLIAFLCLISKMLEFNTSTLTIKPVEKGKIPSMLEVIIMFKEPLITITGCCLSLAMTLAIGFLFIMQTRGILYNFTTIEIRAYVNSYDNPHYNPNDKLNNFKMVMGDKAYLWFIPVIINSDNNNNNNNNIRPDNKIHVPVNNNFVIKSPQNNNYLSLTENGNEYDDNIHISLNLND
jgi:hypothetical protein